MTFSSQKRKRNANTDSLEAVERKTVARWVFFCVSGHSIIPPSFVSHICARLPGGRKACTRRSTFCTRTRRSGERDRTGIPNV